MEIVNLTERNTLSVRLRSPVSKLPEVMGVVFGEIAAHAGAAGIQFAGAPFAMYYNMDMDDLDVEMGFPVMKPAQGAGRVKPGKLPACKAVTAVHVGPYSNLAGTYEAATAFIAQGNLVPESFMWEEYLNDPASTPEGKLETRVCFPLKQ